MRSRRLKAAASGRLLSCLHVGCDPALQARQSRRGALDARFGQDFFFFAFAFDALGFAAFFAAVGFFTGRGALPAGGFSADAAAVLVVEASALAANASAAIRIERA